MCWEFHWVLGRQLSNWTLSAAESDYRRRNVAKSSKCHSGSQSKKKKSQISIWHTRAKRSNTMCKGWERLGKNDRLYGVELSDSDENGGRMRILAQSAIVLATMGYLKLRKTTLVTDHLMQLINLPRNADCKVNESQAISASPRSGIIYIKVLIKIMVY